jgi:NAD(P)-dependent dehydrogenase (short-subunit alcohol dehydrogenase family)
MTGRLDGKVAIVTGAAQGIGAATARLMVAEGASVVLADLDEPGVQRIADALGDQAVAHGADVMVEDDVAALVQTAITKFGRLDALHNNAVTSWATDTDAVGTPDSVWLDTFQVIVMAAAYGCRHAIPVMLETGGGAIVNTSSGAARSPTGSRIAYGSCKAALETFTMYTATIHGPQGIRCNAVAPGFVLTEGTRELFDDARLDAFANGAAAGRACAPEDIADVVVFLSSDEARYVSGQTIVVNGGGARALAW